MFAPYEKMFALAEKCVRHLNKKNGAKKGKSEIKKLEREQLNNYNFQRNEQNRMKINKWKKSEI